MKYITRRLNALVLSALIVGMTAFAFASSADPVPDHASSAAPDPERLKVMFLGDGGHHQPAERLRDAARPMLDRGIELYYTENLEDVNLETLRRYDALMLYANYEGDMPAETEEALLTYVAEGGGFVPVHSASGNFRTSKRFIDLLGGQFASHGTGVFRTRIAEPDHEIMQGFDGFESWDETYVHKNHNAENRTVLSYRDDEPWTWTRTHGQGRVFYTAWGHDERTWRNPGFHELLERGIRWAAGQDVQQALASRIVSNPFTYDVLDVPYPPPHETRVEYEKEVGPMDRQSNYPLYHKMQKALSGEQAIERMIVPAGFRVELFAEEPQIVNPIAMAWDERGRLWVVESIEYPYPGEFWPDGGGKDRIVILEDTDGDGRADKETEFAGGLNIPTALTFVDDGVIVQQAPQTLFLKDTDGDDKADVRKALFEGWSQRDTHAGPSNVFYGLDNWIWGVLGYSGFKGTVGGESHDFAMGVYRFKKDGSRLEFLRRTNNNTWGLGFSEAGDAFASTANGNPSTYVPFARRYYDLVDDLDDSITESLTESARMIPLTNLFRQVDWVGAYTAGAGHALYTARDYPEEYWNRIAFVTEATGGLVGEFVLEDEGSSYKASHPRNLIASDDEWFSPVAAEVGPDGSVWIADWYNYVIQHNAESDRQRASPGNAYANPLRDREHGRIYRIVYDGGPPSENLSLRGASPEKLVETLRHDNLLWRKHAQRLLVERAETDVVPALIALVNDRGIDAVGLNVGAIHGLWTLHGLAQLDGRNEQALAAAVSALGHPSTGVRQNAVQVLPKTESSLEAILEAGLLEDEHPRVRREALLALAEMPASGAVGEAIYAMLGKAENVDERWVRESVTLAASVHAEGFLGSADRATSSRETASDPVDSENLLANASFEHLQGDVPVGWSSQVWNGDVELSVAPGEGREGGNALKAGSNEGGNARWAGPDIPIKKNTSYQFGGWIRTENVDAETGPGAMIQLNGLQERAQTPARTGTGDWVYVETIATSLQDAEGNVDLFFGGTGEAWFDDVFVKEIGRDPKTTPAGIVDVVRRRSAGMAGPGDSDAAAAEADRVLELETVPDEMRFDRDTLRARAGETVRLELGNPDHMEHNALIIRPGTLRDVGRLADEMIASPAGRRNDYVPNTPDVVASSPIVQPYETFELTFTVPDEPGEYMFICTIPGHWRVMQGTFIVEPRDSNTSP